MARFSIVIALFLHSVHHFLPAVELFVLPNELPGSSSISHYRGAEEFFDGIEDGADDSRRRPSFYGSSLQVDAYPENDGFLYGGYPEIPGVVGDAVGFYEEEDNGAGNGDMSVLDNLMLDMEQPSRWAELHSFLERQEKKMVDVGHLELVADWPKTNVSKKLGQVSGVGVCKKGIVHVIHRGGRQWFEAFGMDGETKKDLKPISENVVLSIDPKTGEEHRKPWGGNLFYMPHGITLDHEGNFWITDIATHQVFKFTWNDRQKPALILGEKLVSGHDEAHFCKPTDIAVATSGEIFVADGYCNSRILKFDKTGKLLKIWGKKTTAQQLGPRAPLDTLSIPHSVHLDETRDTLLVADRENQRIVAFDAGLRKPENAGRTKRIYADDKFGRIFAVTVSPKLGVMYALSSTVGETPSQGFTVDLESGETLERWTKTTSSSPRRRVGFGEMPHDVDVSPVDGAVYVAQVDANDVTKFKHVQY